MERKDLFNRFLENGGTVEEFFAGRRNALKQAEARSIEHQATARAARRDQISDLMDKGYTRFEAEEALRLETYHAMENAHLIPLHKKIVRCRVPRIGLTEMAPGKK